ncbi:MAG TPA: extensin family protein, partial [Aliiroseovarius sp.]|nr:extensin family protein [Aliiroseovarius sp.]
NPVSVTSVSGVRLTTAATLSCETAKALNTWVRRGVMPAVGNRGGGLASLKVIAHYSCRTRNNQPGAKISEHGRGKAIDIAGIYLNNGDYISVLEGWRSRRDARLLKAMHRSACGIFGTVLGPDANRFHRDHLHVDTAHYRSGSYCK